ncbi:hypothetical protein E6C60_0730 [Paenibacillus algicola]|uniref:Lipoprotein YerB n=1 Tax=Paenibacillus algicola TaxID=2565926 RepID=A0A4P8XJC0_9BACL|nr:DUF3048 domain-containing protein [Paenibacillus algicola]QCT01451.1 hypothetical protein E6C60_0730 [Paenibacillus algicola]
MKHSSKGKVTTMLLGITAAFMLSACSGDQATESSPVKEPIQPPAVEQPVETPPAAEEQPEANSAFTAPLTGQGLEQPSDRRPLAVMMNNAPAARPQSGLSQADLVYEVLAEGGITRLIAIYQSQTGIEKIGPVRSIRPYLIDIGESYDGVLVHAGGSPEAYTIIQRQKKQDLDEIGSAGAYFWRTTDRKAPHNLYTSEEKLREAVLKHSYPQESEVPEYDFLDAAAPADDAEGEPAIRVDLTFLLGSYNVGYTYDEETGTYKRSINNQPHIDKNNNAVLEAANVVVLSAEHKVLDEVGRLAVNLEQGGEAMLFRKGKVIKGEWSRKQGDVIRFLKDGKEVPFYPGTTYFNIVPSSPSFASHVTISNP